MTEASGTGAGWEECPRIVAVIPAYNEERFIGSVVLRTRKYVDAVIVVDDGSTDATAEIAEAAGAIVLRHDQNRGKGAALNTGFCKARDLGPEVVVMLDGDGQHLLSIFARHGASGFRPRWSTFGNGAWATPG